MNISVWVVGIFFKKKHFCKQDKILETFVAGKFLYS